MARPSKRKTSSSKKEIPTKKHKQRSSPPSTASAGKNVNDSPALSPSYIRKRRQRELEELERQRKEEQDYPQDEDGYHATSKWQEPPRQDGLTLYEIHRQPRKIETTVSAAMHTHPGQSILDATEFRCVICLDTISQTTIVCDCLHRFCKPCIDACLKYSAQQRVSKTVMNGPSQSGPKERWNECPICRIDIPSRRSLLADTKFDELVQTIAQLSSSNDNHTDGTKQCHDTQSTRSSTSHIKSEKTARMGSKRAVDLSAKEVAMRMSLLQRAIHHKRTLVQCQKDRESETDVKPMAKKEAKSKQPTKSSKLVSVLLRPTCGPNNDRPLERPYLRLNGAATMSVLERLLELNFDSRGSFEIFRTSRPSKRVPPDTSLQELIDCDLLARTNQDDEDSRNDTFCLYYRHCSR